MTIYLYNLSMLEARASARDCSDILSSAKQPAISSSNNPCPAQLNTGELQNLRQLASNVNEAMRSFPGRSRHRKQLVQVLGKNISWEFFDYFFPGVSKRYRKFAEASPGESAPIFSEKKQPSARAALSGEEIQHTAAIVRANLGTKSGSRGYFWVGTRASLYDWYCSEGFQKVIASLQREIGNPQNVAMISRKSQRMKMNLLAADLTSLKPRSARTFFQILRQKRISITTILKKVKTERT